MSDPVLPLPFHDLPSCIAFIEKHRKFFNEDVDAIAEEFTEWRGTTIAGKESFFTHSVGIVCPGHFAFEQDGTDLAALWETAGRRYATGTYAYENGCDGSCVTGDADA